MDVATAIGLAAIVLAVIGLRAVIALAAAAAAVGVALPSSLF